MLGVLGLSGGMKHAPRVDVVVRRFEDLVAWQLASEVKRETYAIVARTTAVSDFKFRDQIKDAAASAPSAIAEGFERYHHPEFAYFLGVAKASLGETQNHLLDGIERRHWTMDDIDAILRMAARAKGAVLGLLKHVRSTDAPGPPRRSRRR